MMYITFTAIFVIASFVCKISDKGNHITMYIHFYHQFLHIFIYNLKCIVFIENCFEYSQGDLTCVATFLTKM